jgi:hypothetical protein
MFQVKKRQPKIFETRNHQDPSIRKKNMTILFFVYFDMHNNKINTIYNQCFCFDFFHVGVLVVLAKQQQQIIVNLHTISVGYTWSLKTTNQNKKNPKKLCLVYSQKKCSFIEDSL